MSTNKIHQNDIGVTFKITVKERDVVYDVSSSTSRDIVFKKPSGDLVTKTASFFTDGTDGIITYTTISGDLDEIGSWQLQAIITEGSSVFHSEIESFKVHRNL
jgi:hypothetical protein